MSEPVLRLKPEQAQLLTTLQRSRDPYVWASEVFGVTLNPAQKRWFSLIKPDEDGWEWRYKAVLHVAANQIGKTLGLALLITWAAWHKIGVDPSDPERWQATPYMWFHLAPSQQQAYLVLNDIKWLIDGNHLAQAQEGFHRKVIEFIRPLFQVTKIEQYYDGLQLWNGSIIQFRTTDDKAKALQGRRAAGISYDEAAFEDHLISVVNETLMMRLISTGGPIWLVSTPDGINDWYEIVTRVQDEAMPRKVIEDPNHPLLGGSAVVGEPLPIWDNGQGWALVWSTIADNIGYGIPPEEAERMERDINSATKEQQLRGAFLEPREAFFVPVDVIDKAFKDLPEEVPPQYDHQYAIMWDPSDATDPTVVIVIDITEKPWRGVYFRRYERPGGETWLLSEIYKVHALYNGGGMPFRRHAQRPTAVTAIDKTSMGGSMIARALDNLTPKKLIELAGPNAKRVGLTNLRTALSTGALILPKAWSRVRREVLTYKLPDDDITQDCVMTLLGNVEVATTYGGGRPTRKFSIHGRVS